MLKYQNKMGCVQDRQTPECIQGFLCVFDVTMADGTRLAEQRLDVHVQNINEVPLHTKRGVVEEGDT